MLNDALPELLVAVRRLTRGAHQFLSTDSDEFGLIERHSHRHLFLYNNLYSRDDHDEGVVVEGGDDLGGTVGLEMKIKATVVQRLIVIWTKYTYGYHSMTKPMLTVIIGAAVRTLENVIAK